MTIETNNDSAGMGAIRFFTPTYGENKLADVLVMLPAPWGTQECRAMIIASIRDKRPRVLWPKAGPRFATTPSSREETVAAEVQILEAWKAWKR